MNANDKTEKVLREIHIMLSKAEPYKPEPSRVIINKQQMIDLLAELNKCIYAMQDEYELTEQSRNHAEREFRKKGDQIVWDASRKAEDVYAASVIYTDEALSRVRDIINDTNESLEKLCKNMKDKIAEQEKIVKTNQYELKGQLQDLSDTEKYLKIIDDRNKEIERQKNAGKPVEERTIDKEEKSIYANRQTEIKVNMDYIRKLGLAEGEDLGDGVVGEVKLADDTPDAGSIMAMIRMKPRMPAIHLLSTQWKGRSSQPASTECGRASPEIKGNETRLCNIKQQFKTERLLFGLYLKVGNIKQILRKTKWII